MKLSNSERSIVVRVATAMLVGTFLDDGIRELWTFRTQCEYLQSHANIIRVPHPFSVAYVLISLLIQLFGGGYVLLCALCSPNALTLPAFAGNGWRWLRATTLALAGFVMSSIVIYGFGQPASQHAQGRLVFLLRNASILGGVLVLVAARQTSNCMTQLLRLLARLLLAAHGFEVAPAKSVSVVAVVDFVCFPLTGLLIIGLYTQFAALALIVADVLSDLTLNHFWFGFRYNDNIRYYFFEDLSIIGGLVLFAVTSNEENDVGLDSCRTAGKEMLGRGSIQEKRALLDEGDEWEVGD